MLVEGFFPRVGLDDKPAGRRSGFQEFGLPFAPDPAITRYLAAFLTAHRHVAMDEIDVTGGPRSGPARYRAVQRRRVRVAAVARAIVGGDSELVQHRRRLGSRWCSTTIGSIWPLPAERPTTAWCGAGRACESPPDWPGRITSAWRAWNRKGVKRREGMKDRQFAWCRPMPSRGKTSNLPIGDSICWSPSRSSFRCLFPARGLTDKPGELVAIDRERMTPLPPIRTVLKTRKKGEAEIVSVTLHARLTEIGTLDLWCSEIGGRRSWRLQFDVRSATQTDVAAHESAAEQEGFVDEAIWQECEKLIRGTFGPDGQDKPEGLVKRLAAATGMNRNAWPTSLCRRMWEALMEVEAGRRRSPVHEARWLNLLGFALRPGFGLAVDDWRVAQTWTALQGKFAFPASRAEGWILWRRIGGGLAAGQQQALAEPLLGPIRGLHRQLTTGKGAAAISVSPRTKRPKCGDCWARWNCCPWN